MTSDNKEFNKSKVFVTGITGFIGFELAKKLREDGYSVYGMFRHSPRGSEPLKVLRNLGVRTYEGNIKDYPYLCSILSEVSPEYIIHLAALTPVSLSFERWDEYYQNNFLGTVYLAQAAQKILPSLKKFVYASTMEVYGIQDSSKGPFDEKRMPSPNSPYAVSKLAAEQHLINMYRMYRFPSIALRLSNCFGRKFDKYFIIEAVINKILTNRSNSIDLGTGDAVRSFIYIEDTLDLYKILMTTVNKEALGQVFNSGPSNGTSIKDVVEIISKKMKFKGHINWGTREYRPGEIMYLDIINDKAQKLFNWKPKYSLEAGIDESIKYWKNLKESNLTFYNNMIEG